MRLPTVQINPTSRTASVMHSLYLVMLPLIVVGLVYFSFLGAAFLIIILSKWRMFAVKPRYWLANIRANLVDITVGFSAVIFIAGTDNFTTILIWAGLWTAWLILLKPRSDPLSIAAQGFVAQGVGLVALYGNYAESNQAYLILLTWLICFSAARHLLVAFEDNANRILSHVWAIFGAYMALILGHWHIVYADAIPQIALLLSIIGYALGVGYYVHKTKGLRAGLRRQLVALTIIALTLIIVLSEWQAVTF
jgi:hypothetical protein